MHKRPDQVNFENCVKEKNRKKREKKNTQKGKKHRKLMH